MLFIWLLPSLKGGRLSGHAICLNKEAVGKSQIHPANRYGTSLWYFTAILQLYCHFLIINNLQLNMEAIYHKQTTDLNFMFWNIDIGLASYNF